MYSGEGWLIKEAGYEANAMTEAVTDSAFSLG